MWILFITIAFSHNNSFFTCQNDFKIVSIILDIVDIREVFANALQNNNILSTRLPREDLEGANWIEQPRSDFYHQVVQQSHVASSLFTARNIK